MLLFCLRFRMTLLIPDSSLTSWAGVWTIAALCTVLPLVTCLCPQPLAGPLGQQAHIPMLLCGPPLASLASPLPISSLPHSFLLRFQKHSSWSHLEHTTLGCWVSAPCELNTFLSTEGFLLMNGLNNLELPSRYRRDKVIIRSASGHQPSLFLLPSTTVLTSAPGILATLYTEL